MNKLKNAFLVLNILHLIANIVTTSTSALNVLHQIAHVWRRSDAAVLHLLRILAQRVCDRQLVVFISVWVLSGLHQKSIVSDSKLHFVSPGSAPPLCRTHFVLEQGSFQRGIQVLINYDFSLEAFSQANKSEANKSLIPLSSPHKSAVICSGEFSAAAHSWPYYSSCKIIAYISTWWPLPFHQYRSRSLASPSPVDPCGYRTVWKCDKW